MRLFYLLLLFISITPFQIVLTAQADLTATKIQSSTWSTLSDVEITALNQAGSAGNGDPDALLMLAILASGDIRSQSGYTEIADKIHHFVIQMQPILNTETNTWRKGLKLFLAMHDEFLLSNDPTDELEGYRPNQSQFSQIFRDKTYNCISSTLLYLILARYFDLQVEGVILPSHSFVQLTTPQGQIIEIETTSRTGYGLKHSHEFYTNNASQWSQYRNLETISYTDYLNREIASIYHLITDNMNHQHTSPNLMSESDRNRLYELRAWLFPNNPKAQLFRLYLFNNELIRLEELNDEKSTAQLLKISLQVIEEHYEKALKDNLKLSDKVHQIISYIHIRTAELALNESAEAEAVSHFNKAIKWIKGSPEEQTYRDNIAVSWLTHGNKFFSKKDFISAIHFYKQAYIPKINPQLKQKIDANISSSYWNLSVPYLNQGNSYAAYELLRECQMSFPQIQQCQKHIETICESYSLPACQNL